MICPQAKLFIFFYNIYGYSYFMESAVAAAAEIDQIDEERGK